MAERAACSASRRTWSDTEGTGFLHSVQAVPAMGLREQGPLAPDADPAFQPLNAKRLHLIALLLCVDGVAIQHPLSRSLHHAALPLLLSAEVAVPNHRNVVTLTEGPSVFGHSYPPWVDYSDGSAFLMP